jgi:hypothetical protein
MDTEQLNQKIRINLYNGMILIFRANNSSALMSVEEALKAWKVVV